MFLVVALAVIATVVAGMLAATLVRVRHGLGTVPAGGGRLGLPVAVKMLAHKASEALAEKDRLAARLRNVDVLVAEIHRLAGSVDVRSTADSRDDLSCGGTLEEIQAGLRGFHKESERIDELAQQNLSWLYELRTGSVSIDKTTSVLGTKVGIAVNTVADLNTAAHNIAHLSESASGTVTESLDAMNGVNEALLQIRDSVEASAGISQKTTTTIAEQGMMAVVDGAESIEEIKESVENLNETVDRLAGRSNDIGRILNVIREVTDQTQLLSLNAQILAAQAGAHGRGFSVVANEMHSLSVRTEQSTEEIAALVAGIREEMQTASDGTRRSVDLVKEGYDRVYGIGAVLREILHSSRETSQQARGMLERIESESGRLTELLSDVETIHHMSDDIRKATSRQEANISELYENLGQIRDAVVTAKASVSSQTEGTERIIDNIQVELETTEALRRTIETARVKQETFADTARDAKEDACAKARVLEQVRRLTTAGGSAGLINGGRTGVPSDAATERSSGGAGAGENPPGRSST